MKLTLEKRLDIELALHRVEAHITHLRQPEDCFFRVVTVATPQQESCSHLGVALSELYMEARISKRSDLGKLIHEGFSDLGFGVALCHHLDNFSRKRGRIVAKGRLLKLLEAQL